MIREETASQRIEQREEFITLFKADQLDVDRLHAMMESHEQQREALIPRVMPLVVQLHASLSTEQKDKAIEYMARWHH